MCFNLCTIKLFPIYRLQTTEPLYCFSSPQCPGLILIHQASHIPRSVMEHDFRSIFGRQPSPVCKEAQVRAHCISIYIVSLNVGLIRSCLVVLRDCACSVLGGQPYFYSGNHKQCQELKWGHLHARQVPLALCSLSQALLLKILGSGNPSHACESSALLSTISLAPCCSILYSLGFCIFWFWRERMFPVVLGDRSGLPRADHMYILWPFDHFPCLTC